MSDTTLMHSKYGMRHVCAYMDYITVEINDIDKMIENMISSDLDLKRLCCWAGPAPGSDDLLLKAVQEESHYRYRLSMNSLRCALF